MPLFFLVRQLCHADKFIHFACAPFLLVAENLAVERNIAVLDRQTDQPSLFYTVLDRVPRQKGYTAVNLKHANEQRGITALERRRKDGPPRGKTAVEYTAIVILLGKEKKAA